MNMKESIPQDKCIDSTLNLMLEGYLFIPNRCRKYRSELFETHLMGQKVVCMSGESAAQIFYDTNKFTRKGAMPKRVQETLFGKKAIQTLDGEEHTHRKQLFMSFMTPSKIDQIIGLTKRQWEVSIKRLEKKDEVVIFEEAGNVLFQVACKWAGVPFKKSEVKQMAKDMSAMVDAFGAVGLRHYKGRCARNRTECWAKNLIDDVRVGRLIAPKDSALHDIAWHRQLDGDLLDAQTAGVELINILRPITAIATYITFGALALHMYPSYKEKIQHKEENYLHMFAQEIRRYYPFGPFLGARVRSDFQWHNYQFTKGMLVFLDIYGTNHDSGIWRYPNEFRPKHFLNYDGNPFDFIPQGGGAAEGGNRCPGEWITTELLKVSMDFLANRIEYDVVLQDLSFSLRRMPTIPKSRFIINNVRSYTHYTS
ncbi:MAG TPA: cytochrome P450 [Mobilitalea sp.]|nr:cytochrome P450 [Mobilitalea sp.]